MCLGQNVPFACLPYVYMHFNEGAKICDCCDPVDHVVLIDKFTKTYTLRQGRSLFSDIEPINIVKSYGIHGPYRNMMGCCLVRTLEVS